jgi:hypothetical protein
MDGEHISKISDFSGGLLLMWALFLGDGMM